nr:hypothetical protein Iba_chr07aCG4410 [Ipomoea batatas]
MEYRTRYLSIFYTGFAIWPPFIHIQEKKLGKPPLPSGIQIPPQERDPFSTLCYKPCFTSIGFYFSGGYSSEDFLRGYSSEFFGRSGQTLADRSDLQTRIPVEERYKTYQSTITGPPPPATPMFAGGRRRRIGGARAENATKWRQTARHPQSLDREAGRLFRGSNGGDEKEDGDRSWDDVIVQ